MAVDNDKKAELLTHVNIQNVRKKCPFPSSVFKLQHKQEHFNEC